MNIPQFSQDELNARIELAYSDYEFNLPEFGMLTALEKFMPDSIAHSLELYAEKRKAGYTPSEVTPMMYGTVTPWIEFHLYKPAKQQEKDKAEIAKRVEAAYRAEIDAQLAQLIEIEAARTVERKRRELEAQRQAEETRQLEEARLEVMVALGLKESE